MLLGLVPLILCGSGFNSDSHDSLREPLGDPLRVLLQIIERIEFKNVLHYCADSALIRKALVCCYEPSGYLITLWKSIVDEEDCSVMADCIFIPICCAILSDDTSPGAMESRLQEFRKDIDKISEIFFDITAKLYDNPYMSKRKQLGVLWFLDGAYSSLRLHRKLSMYCK